MGRLAHWFRALHETLRLMEQTPHDDLAARIARLERELPGRTAPRSSAAPDERDRAE